MYNHNEEILTIVATKKFSIFHTLSRSNTCYVLNINFSEVALTLVWTHIELPLSFNRPDELESKY